MRNYNLSTFADLHVHMSELNLESGEAFLNLLADEGITHAALQSLTYRSPYYNLWLLHWKEVYRKIKLAVFGMIHYMPEDKFSSVPFEKQAQALLDMGCDGIKLMFAPDTRRLSKRPICDPCYDAMFANLEREQVPILVHVNDPESFWVPRELTPYEIERNWGYFLEGFNTMQEIYDETFALFDKHPNLKITLAHFFFMTAHPEDLAKVLDRYSGVTLDVTPGTLFYDFAKDISAWRDFFIRYQDRIFFGTDCNNTKHSNSKICEFVRQALSHDSSEFTTPGYEKSPIRGLDLPTDVLHKICYYNYKRLIPTEKPVDKELVARAQAVIMG